MFGWYRAVRVLTGWATGVCVNCLQIQGSVGVRGYLAVRGGIDVPTYLGSRATFPGGKFGGYQGR